MPSSHRRQDKTVLSCQRCELSSRQLQTVSIYLCECMCELVLTQFPNTTSQQVTTLRANWKLSQEKTRLSSHRISRLDKTVSKFSLADSLEMSPIQFTPRTPTNKTVLSCRCRRCELGIIVCCREEESNSWLGKCLREISYSLCNLCETMLCFSVDGGTSIVQLSFFAVHFIKRLTILTAIFQFYLISPGLPQGV